MSESHLVTRADWSVRRPWYLGPLAGIVPLAALDLILFVLPMLVMGLASILVIHEFHVTLRLTADNYLFFLTNPLYLTIMVKTILLAAAVTIVCLIISYPFAFFLTQVPRRIQSTMLVLVILPFWTSYLLRVYAWMTILGERGLINRALMASSLIDEPVRFLLYNNFAIVVVSVYLYIPYCALVLYTSLERLDPSLLAAAMDLGARPWRVFLHIMVPLTLPGIFASFIFVFIPMLGEYVTPTLVGGAQGMMIVNVVVSQFQALRFGVGSAMVFGIAGFTLCLILALRRMAKLEEIFGGRR
jgi:ABC-type spermidine/putrescine transport system permease subunit I